MSSTEMNRQPIMDSKGNMGQSSSAAEDDLPQQHQRQQLPAVPTRFITLPAIFNFGLCLQADWETLATTFQFSLLNGGPASIVYGAVIAGFGCVAVALSLAEMASMDPVVGAQYRWSSRFAPVAPRFWGLMQGWLTIGAWMISAATNPANLANIVTGLIIFNKDNYVYHRWHTALIMWLFILIPLGFNLWFRRVLTIMESSGFIVHICFFIATIVTLPTLARRSTDDYVWRTVVHDISGWTNPAVAFGIGSLSVFLGPVGADGVLHMSAEVKDVRINAPSSIVFATVIGVIMQFAFGICLLYTLGNVEIDTSTPTGLPIIEVYYQATMSKPATNFFIIGIAGVIFVALFNVLASSSRLTWAFARDRGLPASSFFSQIHPTFRIPVNTLYLISAVCFILSLIYIGSSTAFNAIISLTTLSLYVSYVCPILFIMLRKVSGPPLACGPFNLGRWGIPVNLLALVYLIYAIIWIPFPVALPVTAQNMNYAGPIMIIIILGALLDWSISGHKRFDVSVAQPDIEDEK